MIFKTDIAKTAGLTAEGQERFPKIGSSGGHDKSS